MPAQPAILTRRARGGLLVLCLLFVISTSMRAHAYWQHRQIADGTAWASSDDTVDLGGGVRMPRAAVQQSAVWVRDCHAPIFVNLIEAHPNASDPSLVGAPHPGDRVFYVYRGWNLGDRFVTARLNAIYFATKAYNRLTMQKDPGIDNQAVKIIIPFNCFASSEDIMTALRLQHMTTGPTQDMTKTLLP